MSSRNADPAELREWFNLQEGIINLSDGSHYLVLEKKRLFFFAQAQLDEHGRLEIITRMTSLVREHSRYLQRANQFQRIIRYFCGKTTGINFHWDYQSNVGEQTPNQGLTLTDLRGIAQMDLVAVDPDLASFNLATSPEHSHRLLPKKAIWETPAGQLAEEARCNQGRFVLIEGHPGHFTRVEGYFERRVESAEGCDRAVALDASDPTRANASQINGILTSREERFLRHCAYIALGLSEIQLALEPPRLLSSRTPGQRELPRFEPELLMQKLETVKDDFTSALSICRAGLAARPLSYPVQQAVNDMNEIFADLQRRLTPFVQQSSAKNKINGPGKRL